MGDQNDSDASRVALPQPTTQSVCLRSDDATFDARDQSFTFRVAAPIADRRCIRLALGSIELPLSQWTVEEPWRNVYYYEGLRITEQNRTVGATYTSAGGQAVAWQAALPLYVNDVIQVTRHEDRTIRVHCASAHGLFYGAGKRSTIPLWNWGSPIVLVFGSAACYVQVNLSVASSFVRACGESTAFDLLPETPATIVRPTGCAQTTFAALHAEDCVSTCKGAGFLHAPSVPTVRMLADMASTLSRCGGACPSLTFTLRDEHLRVAVCPDRHLRAHESVALHTSGLLSYLGFCNGFASMRASPRTHHCATTCASPHDPCTVVGAPLQHAFPHVSLTPGNYDRGGSAALSDVYMQFNRFYVKQPAVGAGADDDEVKKQLATLAFTDCRGATFAATLLPGVYTAVTMAQHVQHSMRAACPHLPVSVSYDAAQEAFVFHANAEDGTTHNFALDFVQSHTPEGHPPVCMRLGFRGEVYKGAHAYASVTPVRCDATPGHRPRELLYFASETPLSKTVQVTATPVPPHVLVPEGGTETTVTFRSMCARAPVPYVSAAQPGDVVMLQHPERPEARMAVVVDSIGEDGTSITVRRPGGATLIGPALATCGHDARASLIFGNSEARRTAIPRSIVHDMLGFPPMPQWWGECGAMRVPLPAWCGEQRHIRTGALVAPHAMALQHPDVVYVDLQPGCGPKPWSALHVVTHKEAANYFAKLVFYPSYRQERMIHQDYSIPAGDGAFPVKVRFVHGDMLPYITHNAPWSMTLNISSFRH